MTDNKAVTPVQTTMPETAKATAPTAPVRARIGDGIAPWTSLPKTRVGDGIAPWNVSPPKSRRVDG